MSKYVYAFREGDASMRNLLGGKGANLAEMMRLGLPVPRGFTITTEACTRYYEDGEELAPDIRAQIDETLAAVEEAVGKKLGDPEKPFLVSVRSGARASMPGMMDTILNLGLNDEVVVGLAKLTDNPRFARDSYRRFIMMFSDVVMDIPRRLFEEALEEMKQAKGVELDNELDADAMGELVDRYLAIYEENKGEAFPQDPHEQLLLAISAVFRSWNNERAIFYRRQHGIPSNWGTAVNVRRWSMATWATPPARALPSHATLPPARMSSLANS